MGPIGGVVGGDVWERSTDIYPGNWRRLMANTQVDVMVEMCGNSLLIASIFFMRKQNHEKRGRHSKVGGGRNTEALKRKER